MRETHIRLEHLAVGYNGKALIHDIEIGVERGEIVTLVGPNGSGKSTILKTITRQLTPVDGAAFLADSGSDPVSGKMKNLEAFSTAELARQMAVVLTGRLQTELMTCRDVTAMGRYPYTGRLGILSEADERKVDAALQAVHAQALAERPFDAVSDGERQRILLARAICQEPEIIVLDEPTSYLDIRHKLELLSILYKMSRDRGITVVMSLHEVDLAMKISDRVICVRGEEIFACGKPEQVLDNEAVQRLYDLDPSLGWFDARTGSLGLRFADARTGQSARTETVSDGETAFAESARTETVSDGERASMEGGTQGPGRSAETAAVGEAGGPDPAFSEKSGHTGIQSGEEAGEETMETDTEAAGEAGEEEEKEKGERKEGKEGKKEAENRESLPRILLAAPASGSGKTLVTCGLLRLLQRHQLQPAAFKCGPDYIDPMFHRQVLGIPSRNLDTFFSPARPSIDSFPKKNTCKGAVTEAQRADQAEPGNHPAQDLPPGEKSQVLSAGEILARAVRKYGAQTAVIEGVMGYFDGTGADGMQASARDLALQTQTPVVLIVNAKGMSRSIVPLLQGFSAYEKKDRRIRGVLLNRISAGMYPLMKKWIEEDTDLQVLGWLPQEDGLTWGSRHLGLLQPEEVAGLQQQIDRLADRLEGTLDLDALLAIARSAPPLPAQGKGQAEEKQESDAAKAGLVPASGDETAGGKTVDKKNAEKKAAGEKTAPRIAVARDEAFSFYYEDNLELLQECGAELVFFSPLRDETLPEADGLLLGGGYPELHAQALAENRPMKEQIRAAAAEGMPILAECGGFMYLQEYMETNEPPGAGESRAEDAEGVCRPGTAERAQEAGTEDRREAGRKLPMCGVLPGTCRMTDRLVRFGYLELENRPEKESDADKGETALPEGREDAESAETAETAGKEADPPKAAGYLPAGHTIRGHEFHYFDSTDNGAACTAFKPGRRRSWNCMVVQGNIMAGFPHLYYRSDPAFAQAFVDRCRDFAQGRAPQQ